jgi:hypothetical protein
MTSKLKTDVLETVSGSGTIALTNQLSGMTSASMPSGSGVQLQYTSSTINITTSSTTKVSVTSIVITPKSASSKLKITLQADWQHASGNDAHIWLARNDGAGVYNAITDGSWSTAASNDGAMWQYFYLAGTGNSVRTNTQVWVCDAKVTTPITFEVWMGVVGSGTINIGANNSHQQLIVEEIL